MQYSSPETLEAERSAQVLWMDAVSANVAGEPYDAEGAEFIVVMRA